MGFNFVSVSGVSEVEQVEKIGKIYRDERLPFPVVIGYQVSSKSIREGLRNPRQPFFKDLGDLERMTRENGLITAVHYYTKDSEMVMGDIETIAETGLDPSQTLLQFNTLPLQSQTLEEIKSYGFSVIFKVAVSDKQSRDRGYAVWKGEGVQDVNSGEVSPLVEQVLERKNSISYVMFDPSHGTNLGLDLDEESLAVRFGKEIIAESDLDHLGLVYAGGINPGNVMQLIQSLRSYFPGGFSVDVESGVRSDDKLDIGLVRDYLVNCKRALV
jgi:phosphoribosylanthranilate isomerase